MNPYQTSKKNNEPSEKNPFNLGEAMISKEGPGFAPIHSKITGERPAIISELASIQDSRGLFSEDYKSARVSGNQFIKQRQKWHQFLERIYQL